MDDWTFSRHAVERALDMALSADELTRAIRTPDQTYPSAKYPDCTVHQSGRIALAVDPATRTVITVLWNGYFSRERDHEMPLIRDPET